MDHIFLFLFFLFSLSNDHMAVASVCLLPIRRPLGSRRAPPQHRGQSVCIRCMTIFTCSLHFVSSITLWPSLSFCRHSTLWKPSRTNMAANHSPSPIVGRSSKISSSLKINNRPKEEGHWPLFSTREGSSQEARPIPRWTRSVVRRRSPCKKLGKA